MKKALSVLLAAGILSSVCAVSLGTAAADGAEGSEGAAAGIALKYTGQKDDLGFPTDWSGDDVHELKKVGSGTSDTTGSFQVKWDEEAIYVKAVIADATTTGLDADNDQLKVLLDLDGKPAGDAAISFGGDKAVNAGINAWNSAPYYMGNKDPLNGYDGGDAGKGVDLLKEQSMKFDYADGKYTVLLVLKVKDEMKAKLADNSEIGFDIRWNDFNGATGLDDPKATTIGWASSHVKWNDDLREIGAITLLNERPAPPEPAEPAVGTAIYGTPEMDGNLSEWADVPAYELKNVTDNKSISGTFKMMWDEDAFYVALQTNDPDSQYTAFKVLFNLDGVPAGENRVMLGDSAPFAGVYSANVEGYTFGGVPTNAGFSLTEGDKQYGEEYAGKAILDTPSVSVTVSQTEPLIYELKYYFNAESKAKLKENAKIGFDIMYLDAYGLQDTSDLRWASTAGKESFGLDLRDAGEVTLAPAPAIEPLEPTEGAPKAITPADEDITSTTVDLRWELDENATGYDILVFKVTQSGDLREYTFLSKQNVAGSTLTVENLEPGNTYGFQVLAANENGERVAVYEMVYARTPLADDDTPIVPGDTDSDPDDEVPDTGVSDTIFVVIGMLGISGAAFCLLRRRKED